MEIKDRGTNRVTTEGFVAVQVVNPKGQDDGHLCVETVKTVLTWPTVYKVLSAAYKTKEGAEAFLDGVYETTKILGQRLP